MCAGTDHETYTCPSCSAVVKLSDVLLARALLRGLRSPESLLVILTFFLSLAVATVMLNSYRNAGVDPLTQRFRILPGKPAEVAALYRHEYSHRSPYRSHLIASPNATGADKKELEAKVARIAEGVFGAVSTFAPGAASMLNLKARRVRGVQPAASLGTGDSSHGALLFLYHPHSIDPLRSAVSTLNPYLRRPQQAFLSSSRFSALPNGFIACNEQDMQYLSDGKVCPCFDMAEHFSISHVLLVCVPLTQPSPTCVVVFYAPFPLQLAFLIGHECSHVIFQHQAEIEFKRIFIGK